MGKNILAEFKFFSEVPPETLEAIARQGELLEFAPDDAVFQYGAAAEHLYGLVEGEIDLSIVFKDKVLKTEIEYEEAIQASMVDEEKSIVIDTVLPGQIFGWASLVGPNRRTVTARCAVYSKVIALAADDLKAMFAEDYFLGFVLMKKLSDIIAKRLKKRTDKLIETWVEAFDADAI
jgi:CRP/FNR family transcriptional regulator, cyclic AMP receptor protein